jgi:hypothetical protein
MGTWADGRKGRWDVEILGSWDGEKVVVSVMMASGWIDLGMWGATVCVACVCGLRRAFSGRGEGNVAWAVMFVERF